MSEIAIKVKDLGKRFRIRKGKRAGYQTLRDQIANVLASPFHRLMNGDRHGSTERNGNSSQKYEFIWALKDVNFEINRGEVVGVIGANGAGKSTLLKTLTRITNPTEGSIDIYGRVGSLLEVGTGFHKELTGRENVYLNGAILGMKKVEIDQKFDEIVFFSEVEKFIDTPVKYYSSGMQVRLAFAVAAHLEPEILLVDEVLAVGDVSFQKKCLNKMEDVGKKGRTVLFVSHHMPSITLLCKRALLLSGGKLVEDGPAFKVVGKYLSTGLSIPPEREWKDLSSAPGNEIVKLIAVRVKTKDGKVRDTIDIREPIGIEMEYEVLTSGQILYPHFTVHNDERLWLFSSIDTDSTWRRRPRSVGHYVSTGWVPGNLLAEGTIIIGPAIRTEEPLRLHFYDRNSIAFQVVESSDGDTARVDAFGPLHGVVRPFLEWSTEYYPKEHKAK